MKPGIALLSFIFASAIFAQTVQAQQVTLTITRADGSTQSIFKKNERKQLFPSNSSWLKSLTISADNQVSASIERAVYGELGGTEGVETVSINFDSLSEYNDSLLAKSRNQYSVTSNMIEAMREPLFFFPETQELKDGPIISELLRQDTNLTSESTGLTSARAKALRLNEDKSVTLIIEGATSEMRDFGGRGGINFSGNLEVSFPSLNAYNEIQHKEFQVEGSAFDSERARVGYLVPGVGIFGDKKSRVTTIPMSSNDPIVKCIKAMK